MPRLKKFGVLICFVSNAAVATAIMEAHCHFGGRCHGGEHPARLGADPTLIFLFA